MNWAKLAIRNPNFVQKQSASFGRHQTPYTERRFTDPIDAQRLLQANAKAPTQITHRTKQIVIVKTAICQQDHGTISGQNGGCFLQNVLVLLKCHHCAPLLQDHLTQRQCSTAIDQCYPYQNKFIPQTAAIQSKINLVPSPIHKRRLRQTLVEISRHDLAVSATKRFPFGQAYFSQCKTSLSGFFSFVGHSAGTPMGMSVKRRLSFGTFRSVLNSSSLGRV